MSIQTGTNVLENIYTGKSVTIMILKHPTNGMSINGYIIKHKQSKTCQLIDMSVQSDGNISAKEFEMSNDTTYVVALGMIKKGTQKYVSEIPGNLSLAEFQKIVLNSIAHIIRRTLSL